MKTITTSLYAVANSSIGSITADKEYPVYKILERKYGRRIVIINDKGVMEDWGVNFFTFIQR